MMIFQDLFFDLLVNRSLVFPFAAKPSIVDAAEKDAATV
jgi:hypothetical protein